jgi:hypothetical protein
LGEIAADCLRKSTSEGGGMRRKPFNMDSRRAREISMLVLHRHRGLPDTDDRDIYLEMAAHHLRPKDGDLIFALGNWARRLGAIVPERELQEVVSRVENKRLRYRADTIGRLLRVTNNERSAIKLTTIGCYDVSKAEREQLRKQRRRLREQNRRRQSGATPRNEYLASSLSRRQPWLAEGVSRRTWYRRQGRRQQSHDGNSRRRRPMACGSQSHNHRRPLSNKLASVTMDRSQEWRAYLAQ